MRISTLSLSLSLLSTLYSLYFFKTLHNTTPTQYIIFFTKKISLSLSPSQISKHCQESRETRENLKITTKFFETVREIKITESEDDDVKSLNQDVRWSGSAPDTSISSDKDRYGLYSFRTASSVVE